MKDVTEVLEGSLVSAGSQGTEFVASRDSRLPGPAEALKAARDRHHEPIELCTREGDHWALD